MVRGARAEAQRHAPDSYAEIRYEDFVAAPRDSLRPRSAMLRAAVHRRGAEFLARRAAVRDMNQRPSDVFTEAENDMLRELIGDELTELGYLGGGDRHERPLSLPFAGAGMPDG